PDAPLGEAGPQGAVEVLAEQVERLASAAADQVDLARNVGGPLDRDGDALAGCRPLDHAQLIGRDLELEAAPLDARPLAGDLHELAANAAPHHLDHVASHGRPANAPLPPHP